MQNNFSRLASANWLQISVIFSVLFEKRWSHQMSSWENEVWIQSDCVGNVVEIFFKFNCSSGKCSVILQDLPPVVPLNFLGFIKNYPACRPAACKKFLQSQLGLLSMSPKYLPKQKEEKPPREHRVNKKEEKESTISTVRERIHYQQTQ